MVKLISAIIMAMIAIPTQQVIVEEEVEIEIEPVEVDDRRQALVQATWRIETGNGTSSMWLNNNNAGGIKCGREYCSYDSQEDGLEALESLVDYYIDEFDYNLKDIRYRYCGSHCGQSDLDTFTQIYNEELQKENPKGD